jgi:protein OS-9
LSGHTPPNTDSDKRDLERHAAQKPLGGGQSTGNKYSGEGEGGDDESLHWDPAASLDYFSYEAMKLDGLRYLCNIPRVGDAAEGNATSDAGNGAANNQTKEENEIARATDRGLELLQEMEGTCMYYVSGWWSYSFCYQKQIKQFHARSGAGVPNYPPIEDPTSHSFILGKFQRDDDEEGESDPTSKQTATTSTAELQTKGESRYLVQKLAGGTICDLTGTERKVEVQFHCNPQSTDRIGWIKEITTCSYLMVIYTPRLCHDVAFQLPQPEDTHSIQCREILAPEEIEDFEAMKAHHESQRLLVNSGASEPQVIGGIEVGAMRQVGSEGKVIQKGRMAKIGEESAEIVAKREGGKLTQMSKEDLKRWDLDPKEVEAFRKQLDEMADGKDWKLELVESNGDRVIRAIVDSDVEDGKKVEGDAEADKTHPELKKDTETSNDNDDQKEAPAPKEEDLPADQEMGSEETFKDEL